LQEIKTAYLVQLQSDELKKPPPEDFSSGGGPATLQLSFSEKKTTEPLNFYATNIVIKYN